MRKLLGAHVEMIDLEGSHIRLVLGCDHRRRVMGLFRSRQLAKKQNPGEHRDEIGNHQKAESWEAAAVPDLRCDSSGWTEDDRDEGIEVHGLAEGVHHPEG